MAQEHRPREAEEFRLLAEELRAGQMIHDGQSMCFRPTRR
jgi:hypothetical protein